MGKYISIGAAILLLGCWMALFFSGQGVLLGTSKPSGGVGMMSCQYFTGTGVVDRAFLYTRGGALGRDTCPRFVDVTE